MIDARTIVLLTAGSAALTLGIYGASLIPSGTRTVSSFETIQSIPYAADGQALHIDEALAHADLYVEGPVFAKELVLTIEFIPSAIDTLSVGVRENSFWLSYPKYTIYSRKELSASTADPPPTGGQPITSTVVIPLTDKLQEPDQSIDLMFFAEGNDPEWKLVQLVNEVRPALPTWAQFKDYARAILYRERAL